ncbi:hypothetical protein GCM10010353_48170 [Streptomyces chryseus]|nr:hypothetical protein GCM10010353_48170 [Streptomyces chryseus]
MRKAELVPHRFGRLRFGFSLQPEVDGVGILSTGEEEVKVTKSEVPVLTGTWCERETLRR